MNNGRLLLLLLLLKLRRILLDGEDDCLSFNGRCLLLLSNEEDVVGVGVLANKGMIMACQGLGLVAMLCGNCFFEMELGFWRILVPAGSFSKHQSIISDLS